MKIDRIAGPAGVAQSPDVKSRSVTPASSPAVGGRDAVPRRDSVEISAEGRELAALDADRAERILIVQARIKQDFYSSPSVQRDVARRMLASGDI